MKTYLDHALDHLHDEDEIVRLKNKLREMTSKPASERDKAAEWAIIGAIQKLEGPEPAKPELRGRFRNDLKPGILMPETGEEDEP